jgi:hypothetical protein
MGAPFSRLILFLICAAVVASGLGGIGGSFQPNRILCLLLFPLVYIRLIHMNSMQFYCRARVQVQSLLFIIVLLLLAVVSLLWSIDRIETIGFITVLATNAIPLIAVATLKQEECARLSRWLPLAWGLAGAFVLPLAAYEIFTGNHFVLGMAERGGGGLAALVPHASGLHGNYNDFSAYLVFCLGGILFAGDRILLGDARIRRRIVAIVSALVVPSILAILLYNASRGAIIAASLLVAAVVVGRGGVGAVLVKVVLVSMGLFYGWQVLIQNGSLPLVEYLAIKFSSFDNSFGDEERVAILTVGVAALADSWGLGAGAGGSNAILALNSPAIIPNPHNLLLQWALDFGVIGLLLLVWFFVCIWRACRGGGSVGFQVRCTVLLIPLIGVIQSHLIGYTYFWLFIASIAVAAVSVSVSRPLPAS